MRYRTLACLALSVLAAACAPPPSDAGTTGPALPGQSASTEAAKRRDRNRITAAELDELRASGAADLLTMIHRARPNWFRVRRDDLNPAANPMILYNDRRLARPVDLRAIPSSVVESVEYIPPPGSLGRYGTNGTYGVIIIRGG
jgi:hypothetical protein